MPASLSKSFEDETCGIYPSNWKTVELFFALETQWRTGMSGVTGLDYAAMPATAQMLGIKVTRERFSMLRHMEMEALRIFSEKSKQKR